MSNEILMQKTEFGLLAPFSEPDIIIMADYKVNQKLQVKITGTRKERSLDQLGTYWRLCKLLSDNSSKPEFATAQHVDWRLRNALQFYDTSLTYVSKAGQVNFKVRSLSYKNLGHAEACNYFDQSFAMISEAMGVPLEVLIDRTKKTMR